MSRSPRASTVNSPESWPRSMIPSIRGVTDPISIPIDMNRATALGSHTTVGTTANMPYIVRRTPPMVGGTAMWDWELRQSTQPSHEARRLVRLPGNRSGRRLSGHRWVRLGHRDAKEHLAQYGPACISDSIIRGGDEEPI